MKMTIVRVELGRRSYDIVIERGLLGRIPEDLGRMRLGERYFLITHPSLEKYGERILRNKGGVDIEVITFPSGEEYKTLATIDRLGTELKSRGCKKHDALLGFGGGLVTDVTSFTAATYMRGINYANVPTTLLSQVDASIGGKNAVNGEGVKNLHGTVYQPRRVYVDSSMLDGLDEREFINGFGEIIKAAIIGDLELFEYLERHRNKILGRDPEAVDHVIERSCRVKAKVVSEDEFDENKRHALNFGHTYGHAIEVASGYSIKHGEAISSGMHYEGRIAVNRSYYPQSEYERQEQLTESLGLPTKTKFTADELLPLMQHDKKNGSHINMVLPKRIGKMKKVEGSYRIPVSEEEIRQATEA